MSLKQNISHIRIQALFINIQRNHILYALFANIRSNVIFATEMLEVFIRTFALNVCKYCTQDLNKLLSAYICICDILCFMKIC